MTCFSAFKPSNLLVQSESCPFVPETVTWATTPSILSLSSFSNPFMIDKTVISTVTPSRMPSIEANEMNEMKRLRRRECVYRCPMNNSSGVNMGGDCTTD